jgi:hypothetical protein
MHSHIGTTSQTKSTMHQYSIILNVFAAALRYLYYLFEKAVFRIRDILRRIRIWITDPDLDPAFFVNFFKIPTKNEFFSAFFCLLRYFLHESSKITSHKEVTKQLKSGVYTAFFCLSKEGTGSLVGSGAASDSVQIITEPDPGGSKTYGS